MPFIDTNSRLSWEYDSILLGIKRKSLSSEGIRFIKNSLYPKKYNYSQLKNYQFVTGITGSGQIGTFSIKFKSPFTNSEIRLRDDVLTNGGVNFYTYNVPNHTLQSYDLITYGSDSLFTQSVIKYTKINELNFLINGFREFTYLDRDIATSSQPSGWFYEKMPGDDNPSYNIFLSVSSSSISPSYSLFGSGLNTILEKNYIAKYIEYDTFNLDFKFSTTEPVKMVIYLLTLDQLANIDSWHNYIVTSFSSKEEVKKEYLGLVGTNYDGSKNYLVFSCDLPQFLPGKNSSLDISCKLKDINIYGTYHPDHNNRLALTDLNIGAIGLSVSNAAYSYTLLNNGSTFSIPSRIGNGIFKSGIWENGVWNNGWRDDTMVKDFDDVYLSILTNSDVSWKIEIRGSTSSIIGFVTGSNISIGNIVAIDINDNRKILKNYYQIEALGVDNGDQKKGIAPFGWIRVNLDTSFPYRRIEKDSPNHKIKVTKNIWLSGGFFNGYFSGVWNNGLFKGFPLLTEMFDSHWIDGLFDGGHFNSRYSFDYDFIGIGTKEACSNNFIELTFASVTPFQTGDYIFITSYPILIKHLGSDLYSGVSKIVDIKDVEDGQQKITINKKSIGKPNYLDIKPDAAPGSVYRYTASSVIQNFKFYDNNRSKIKSSESQLSSAVFNFNSWIDVNYDNTRAVTLGRDFRAYEPLTGRSVNRNNLYGYPTYDILSSASRFRDSNSLNSKLYKLGTKYKIFNDFIGESSQFNEPFSDLDFGNFINAGWTYSYSKIDDFNLKRTENLITLNNNQSIELLNSGVSGNELYVTASNTGFILNNNNVNIKKSRYSVVEFDVITYSVSDINYNYDNPDIYQELSISNIGLTFSKTIDSSGYLTSSYKLDLVSNNNALPPIIDDIVVMVDIYGNISDTTINLKAPNGKVINLKKVGTGLGNRMSNTKFSLREVYTKFSYVTTPYSLNNNTISYFDTYQMDKEIGQGSGTFSSDTKILSDLISDIYGVWTLYIKYNITSINICDLINWSIDIQYKNKIITDNEPTSSLPILNFSNLNYDITTQLSGYDNVQTYKKMNYLPISDNINHLLTKNTFRLDSIESTNPDKWGGFGKNQKTKKYEYFYNKTDMMLNITGNGIDGASASMIVLDNINMYEVDMIPFFKYFDNNIYKGVVFPYTATSPEIDYNSSDFVFIDNISIGLDSINPNTVDTTFIGCGTVSSVDFEFNAKINGIDLPYTTKSYRFVNMINNSDKGSVTSSTTFDSITWEVSSDNSIGQPIIDNFSSNTLYPSISGLIAGGQYTLKLVNMTKNTTPISTFGPCEAIIKVDDKPVLNITVSTLQSLFTFLPNSNSNFVINMSNLINGYTSEYTNGSPSGNTAVKIKIITLPRGSLTYGQNPILITIGFEININTLEPIKYYPEGYTSTTYEGSPFTTSFNYQIIDNEGNSLTSEYATMYIENNIIPNSINAPLSLNISIFGVHKIVYDDIITGYTNGYDLQVASIKIISLPLIGELSIGMSNIISINEIITIQNGIIGGDTFKYHPRKIDNSVTQNQFNDSFKYIIIDSQGGLPGNDTTLNIEYLSPVDTIDIGIT